MGARLGSSFSLSCSALRPVSRCAGPSRPSSRLLAAYAFSKVACLLMIAASSLALCAEVRGGPPTSRRLPWMSRRFTLAQKLPSFRCLTSGGSVVLYGRPLAACGLGRFTPATPVPSCLGPALLVSFAVAALGLVAFGCAVPAVFVVVLLLESPPAGFVCGAAPPCLPVGAARVCGLLLASRILQSFALSKSRQARSCATSSAASSALIRCGPHSSRCLLSES